MHVHAAVDADGLAGHEVAVVGGEKNYRADQIVGILIALEGAALSAVGELLCTGDAFLVWAGDGRPGVIEFTQILSLPISGAWQSSPRWSGVYAEDRTGGDLRQLGL